VSEFLSETDAKNFLRLCKQGRLFEVQNWIAEGKSIRVPPSLRTNPLRVALGAGFHSLVELLAANEPSQEIKDECLGHAVFLKRLDFIELLIEHGAATNSVTLIEVLHICEPAIIRFFLDRGADFITGEPFAFAFRDKNSNRSRKWALEQLASRYNRDEIYRDIWSEPIQRGAKRYGLSDVGLAKVCRKLNHSQTTAASGIVDLS